MSKSKFIRSGFTLIELCAVIVILSILATIAVLSYSKHRADEYDQEALADIHTIYKQASQALSDWTIGTSADRFHIAQGCAGSTISLDDLEEQTSYRTNINKGNWDARLVKLPDAIHHWRYNVCFGWVEVANGTDRVQIPSFIIAASRRTGNEVRYILHGSGIDSPIVGLMMTTATNNLPAGLVMRTPVIETFADIQ